ncbi:MAG TPA: NAD(P)/FAD-dependent oxidoreductase [Nitrososphaeraceae archaeon]|nr:NAD(P)/FAD-dependent oxidoreductase [Nitrososphaeraceae archaeon]
MNTTQNTFDLIVIGTGVTASTVVWECHSAGWKTAVIDSRPYGGTCALRGCDPKKVLVGAAELIDWIHRMENKGICSKVTKDIKINWTELMQFKRTFTEPVPKNREEAFSKAGIYSFHGTARFVGRNTLKVIDDTNKSKEQTIQGKYILIATGAKPAKLNITGEQHVVTSDQFLELDKLPCDILFIGGGYISFEFAHIAARCGSNVTILHRGRRPLVGFDPDLVNLLLKRTQEIGVNVKLESSVKKIEPIDKGRKFAVYSSITHGNTNNAKGTEVIETELIVHGAGRIPDTKDLNLEAAGIEFDTKGGIKVNEYLQSASNAAVYGAGDVAASEGMPLTSVAGYEGGIVAYNLLNGNESRPKYKGIPSVVFTVPPLASVGLQEEAAEKQGLNFRTNYQDTSSWYSSRRIGESCSGFKVLIEKDSNCILGAHVLGPHAEEVINIFALAIRLGLDVDKIKEAIFTYPTNSYDIKYML